MAFAVGKGMLKVEEANGVMSVVVAVEPVVVVSVVDEVEDVSVEVATVLSPIGAFPRLLIIYPAAAMTAIRMMMTPRMTNGRDVMS
jgi:hypothetical protein